MLRGIPSTPEGMLSFWAHAATRVQMDATNYGYPFSIHFSKHKH
jgi:hypothetical protein